MNCRSFIVALSATLFFTQTLFAFKELTQEEFPRGVYSVPFKRTTTVVNSVFPNQDTKHFDIEMVFRPRGSSLELIFPDLFPNDAESYIFSMLGLCEPPGKTPQGFGYVIVKSRMKLLPGYNIELEDNIEAIHENTINFTDEYWIDSTPEQFMQSFQNISDEVQQAGLKAVCLKNPKIMKTIETVFKTQDNNSEIVESHKFQEVFTLFHYVFGAKVINTSLGKKYNILNAEVQFMDQNSKSSSMSNSLFVREFLENSGLTLSEDKTYLIRTLPKNKD